MSSRSRRRLPVFVLATAMGACNTEKQHNKMNEGDTSKLAEFRGLFVRQGDRIADAPEEEIELVKRYPSWNEKGKLVQGRRISINSQKDTFVPGEAVRVVHVVEVVEPDQELYIMGPKTVYNEFVDGKLASPRLEDGAEPFSPGFYDGRVLNSPALDYNYEISEYRFSQPGLHAIYWELGEWRSNTLKIKIAD